jgi:CRISPR/Cas system endoribonuclease Cas6 (RAMP superfamily)
MGEYQLEGSPELLNFALGVGLGARNSAGFGLFDVVDPQ